MDSDYFYLLAFFFKLVFFLKYLDKFENFMDIFLMLA
jgi:hypothetical protein